MGEFGCGGATASGDNGGPWVGEFEFSNVTKEKENGVKCGGSDGPVFL